MKITDVKMEKFSIELEEPFNVAFAEITHTVSIIVKIETDEGYTGYGEAAPFAPVTGETVDGCLEVLRMFRQGLIGMDPLEIEKIHAMMDSYVHGNGSAKCAIDIALYDLKGKFMNQPLYRVLGGYDNQVLNDITVVINTNQNCAAIAICECVKSFLQIGDKPRFPLKAMTLKHINPHTTLTYVNIILTY